MQDQENTSQPSTSQHSTAQGSANQRSRASARAASVQPAASLPSRAAQSTELIMRSVASGFGGGGLPDTASTGQSAELSAASLMQGGAPLDSGMRGQLEGATGHDLSSVRVHTDGAAANAAQSYGAQAFAIGQHVHFGAGQYNPGTAAGRHLIAHEVAHTVQQRNATTVQGMPTVSSPSDAHEIEAERFAAQFALGGPMPGLTPISKGGVARVMIQRRTPGPSIEEIAKALSNQLLALRPQGPEAVVAKVKQMRASADTAETKKAVELAIKNTLNDAERAVLEGRAPKQDAKAGDKTAGDKTAGADAGKAGKKGAGKKGGGKGGPTDLSKGDGEPPADTPGDKKAATDPKGTPAGGKKSGVVDDGKGQAITPTADKAPAPVTPKQALAPGKKLDPNHRALVQQELAFHENWKALSGSKAQRLGHLLGGAPGDVGQGLKGGGIQVGGALAVEFLANKLPVPGVGNMIGGALSGYWLYAGGGAAAVTDLQQGWAALTQGGIGPLQRAADIVQMIKSLMDLVGNVCNVLSGLAYAFAAIAALGGLLSFLCPALAFLVPYIPAAINFGRLCGGVAQVCIAISNIISPIPAAFRALHIVTSDDDPVKLVDQEQQYHSELQGAIANYSSAAFMGARDARTTAKQQGVSGKALTGATLKGLNPFKPMFGGLKAGAASTKDAVGDMRTNPAGVRNAKMREALGMQGKSKQQLRDDGKTYGKEHFNSTQKNRLEGNTDQLKAERDAEIKKHDAEIKKLEQKITERKALMKSKPKKYHHHKKKLTKLEARLADQQGLVDQVKQTYAHRENHQAGLRSRWGGRGAKGDVQGEAGAALDSARGADNSDSPSAQTKVKVERDEKGHIKLPPPPGSLQEVDQLDTEIQDMQQRLKKQQQNTGAANTHSQAADTQARQLGQVSTAADARKGDLDKGKGKHQTVAQANTDARGKTAQNNTSADQGLKKAADALQPIAGPLRTVNGVVQKVPSNRFFNVSGTQKNLSDMTKAVNDITGAGGKQKSAQEQAKMCLDTRDQKIQQAGTQRDANATAITDFKSKVKGDRDTTAQVAADSKQQAKRSKQAELTLEQQIQQKKQTKDQKWTQLVSWAQQHYGTRKAAG